MTTHGEFQLAIDSYLDGRLRNTCNELAEYEPEMNELATRIFGD